MSKKPKKKLHLRNKQDVAKSLEKLRQESLQRQKNTTPTPVSLPAPGTKMADGTIYAGQTKNKKPFYAAPSDVSITMTFNQAAEHIKKVNKEKYLGFSDWRLPTREELTILQRSKNTGAFNKTFVDREHNHKGWYCSSEVRDERAYDQRFVDGFGEYHDVKMSHSSVRLVRG